MSVVTFNQIPTVSAMELAGGFIALT